MGRHLVKAALDAGHEVTIFNRGQTDPGAFPDVEELHGDREGDMSALEGRTFDSVIDTSGYLPRVVKRSAELLRDATDHYCFISSISVYKDFTKGGLHESSAVEVLPEPSEDVEKYYGALKALCDGEVQAVFAEGALIVRPGLIVGPYDPTNRYTYWVTRAATGGQLLAPAPASAPVQFIDVRDLSEWTIALCERKVGGVFNATSTEMPFKEMLQGAIGAAGTEPEIVWVDTDFLVEAGVEEWMELPLWVGSDEWAGIMRVDVSKAVGEGLTFRPPLETAAATLRWASALENPPGTAGLAREKEEALLSSWSSTR